MQSFLIRKLTHEVKDFRHLDLGKQTARLVCAQSRGVTDGEGVWSWDFSDQTSISSLGPTICCHLPRLAPVQSLHTLDFRECHKIPIFQPMSSLIQTGHRGIPALTLHQLHAEQNSTSNSSPPRCSPPSLFADFRLLGQHTQSHCRSH